MRVAITGATGFVGKALLPRLINDGHAVAALVRDPTMTMPGGVRVVRGGLDDFDALLHLTHGADVVLHVAGCVSALRRQDYFEANTNGTIRLAKAATQNGVKRFVYVSSLAAREPKLADYGASKAAAEEALQLFAAQMQICVLRPSAIYGPGDTATLPLLKALTSRVAFIPGTKASRFSMIHVDDVARVLQDTVLHSPAGVFELDDNSGGHTWHELKQVTRAAFGTPSLSFFVPRIVALTLGTLIEAVAKWRGRLGVTSRGQIRQIYHADWVVRGQRWPLPGPTALEIGLVSTIEWYVAHGLLPMRQRADRQAQPKNSKVAP
jgi:nucleoside-diphosphate-sugar epimerase